MNKAEKKILMKDINNAVDAMMSECLVDIPQTLGYSPNAFPTAIVEHIITRIKNTHERYHNENEDE